MLQPTPSSSPLVHKAMSRPAIGLPLCISSLPCKCHLRPPGPCSPFPLLWRLPPLFERISMRSQTPLLFPQTNFFVYHMNSPMASSSSLLAKTAPCTADPSSASHPPNSSRWDHLLAFRKLPPPTIGTLLHRSIAPTTNCPRRRRLPPPARLRPPRPRPIARLSSPSPPHACARATSLPPPTPVLSHHIVPKPAAAPLFCVYVCVSTRVDM